MLRVKSRGIESQIGRENLEGEGWISEELIGEI